MEELMIVANVAIVFGVIYKLFELFAGRRERMMLIEKMGDKLTPETFKNGIMYRPSLYSFGGSQPVFVWRPAYRMLAAWIGGRTFGRICVDMYHPTGLLV